MKALVKTQKGVGNIELKDMPEPTPGPDEVKIEVKAAGICGTDIHIFHDEFRNYPPVILGHEFSGVIAEVGTNVTSIQVGERVTTETAGKICGACRFCRSGEYHLCGNRLGIGSGINGGFAPFCVVRKELIHRLPDNVSFEEGAVSIPLAEAANGVAVRTGISAGELVLLFGPGPIGLLALQIARLDGGIVIAAGTEKDALRLKLAAELGAARTVNVEREDLKAIVMELTYGYGPDVVLECSGAQAAARAGLELVRKGGKFTQMGLHGKPITVDMDLVALKEIRVNGFFSTRWPIVDRALRWLSSGLVQTRPLITHTLPLDQWRKGFDLVEKKQGIKVLLVPQA